MSVTSLTLLLRDKARERLPEGDGFRQGLEALADALADHALWVIEEEVPRHESGIRHNRSHRNHERQWEHEGAKEARLKSVKELGLDAALGEAQDRQRQRHDEAIMTTFGDL